jgi:hypothetical protein
MRTGKAEINGKLHNLCESDFGELSRAVIT